MATRMRRIARFAAAAGLKSAGALALWQKAPRDILGRQRVCVLGLHRVLSRSEIAQTNSHCSMILSITTFARLLDHLQEKFQVIPLDVFLGGMKHWGCDKPACLITFDDGWRDTYTNAFPLLKKFRMPATVFLTTGQIGATGGFWIERLRKVMRARVTSGRGYDADAATDLLVERLKHLPERERREQLQQWLPEHLASDGDETVDAMLTWEQANEMSHCGIEIGAHTVSHPLLSYEADAEVARELTVGKRAIEERLGRKVRSFAYPNGDWNERIRHEVQRAGYDCAFTTHSGWFREGQDVFGVCRILLSEANLTGPNGEFSSAMTELTLMGWR